MHGKNYIEMLSLVDIDLDYVVLKSNSVFLVNIDGNIVDIKSDTFEMTTSKNVIEEKTGRCLKEVFILKEEADSVITYGSEIKLLTDRGVVTYSVEDISFGEKCLAYSAYATLRLKIC